MTFSLRQGEKVMSSHVTHAKLSIAHIHGTYVIFTVYHNRIM